MIAELAHRGISVERPDPRLWNRHARPGGRSHGRTGPSAPAALSRARADQVAELYANWYRTSLSMLFGAAILCLVLWDQASPVWMACWLALILANQAWQGLLTRAWQRARPGLLAVTKQCAHSTGLPVAAQRGARNEMLGLGYRLDVGFTVTTRVIGAGPTAAGRGWVQCWVERSAHRGG